MWKGERPSKAVIFSASVKGKVPALENSTSPDNKPDSQPGSEFGTCTSFTFKEAHELETTEELDQYIKIQNMDHVLQPWFIYRTRRSASQQLLGAAPACYGSMHTYACLKQSTMIIKSINTWCIYKKYTSFNLILCFIQFIYLLGIAQNIW